MRTFIIMIFLAWAGKLSYAQDTAYISKDRTTALFFSSKVRLISSNTKGFSVTDKGNGVLAVKATTAGIGKQTIEVEERNTGTKYRIPVAYSYGRAGRRITINDSTPGMTINSINGKSESLIARQLASGKREDVAADERSGGVKAWINKLSLAGDRLYLRLDLSNRSNLPYSIDFVRFYIRDRKTVDRMATHEQEIVPRYATFPEQATVVKGKEVVKVFAFKRFSLADDQALFVEVYERSGNRHLYLQVRQGDLDDVRIIPVPQQQALSVAAN